MRSKNESVNVWDPLIRTGHWTLVIAFFTAYLTEDDLMSIHVWAGYVVGGYLVMRIVWGFVGGKYVRFNHFVYSPAKITDYLKNLIAGKPQHYIGHNPAGGAMVIALLFSLTGATVTGLKLYAVEDNQGPFALSVQQVQTQFQAVSMISTAKAEDAKDDNAEDAKDDNDDEKFDRTNPNHIVDKQSEAFWEEAHEIFVNLTLLLVCIHILGVIVSSYIDKEKLVKAMLTGKKDIDDTYQ